MSGPVTPLPGLLRPELLLERVVADLSHRFAGIFAVETVQRYVADTHTALAKTALVDAHLPVLTARFATERLTALAQAQGDITTGIPEVLFVCVHNSGRSQMAAALLAHHAAGRVHVRSAGSSPLPIEETVLAVMDDAGIPLADAFPKPLTDEVVRAADVVITMGCGDACPVYPGKRYLDWHIDDPHGRPLDEVSRIRDTLDHRVRQLLDDLLDPRKEAL